MRCQPRGLSTSLLLTLFGFSLALLAPTPPAWAQETKDTPAEKPDAKDTDAKDANAKDTNALVKEAESALQGRDYAEAMRLAEQVLQADPKSRPALKVKAAAGYSLGIRSARTDKKEAGRLFRAAAAAARQVRQGDDPAAKEKPISDNQFMAILYYEARALAQAGEKEQAVESLKQAIENGFTQVEFLEQDEDMAAIRELDSYKTLMADLKKRADEAARASAAKALAENEAFDFGFSLPSVQGGTVSLADYRGNVVIVDFWGTWCPPCRKEIPHFVALNEKHGKAGLRIVGINYEGEKLSKEETQAKIETAIEEFDIPYPCLVGDKDTKGQVPGFRGYPTTLFIDRAGKVRAMTIGYRPYVELETIIQTLLAESSTDSSTGSTPKKPAKPAAGDKPTPAKEPAG